MPMSRAAAVVHACGLEDADAARRSRERIAIAQTKPRGRPKALPKSLRLHKGCEDATDERLSQAKANGESISVRDGARQILDPFTSLRNRQSLSPGPTRADMVMNEALYAAGMKYAHAYEGADLGALRQSSFGPHLPRSTAPTSVDYNGRALSCRALVNQAREVVGPRLLGLLDAVVLEGRTIEAASRQYGMSSSPRMRQTEARVMFVEALHMLVRHWRMYPYQQGEAA